MKHNHVVAAIIIYDERILCMQRDKGKYDYISYKFEFPGGKVEAGETKAEALMRELWEEMDLSVLISDTDFFFSSYHEYPDFAVTIDSFLCYIDSPIFVRREHVAHTWLPVEELKSLDWVDADIPIIGELMERNKDGYPYRQSKYYDKDH